MGKIYLPSLATWSLDSEFSGQIVENKGLRFLTHLKLILNISRAFDRAARNM
jgi:hypothetical protein